MELTLKLIDAENRYPRVGEQISNKGTAVEESCKGPFGQTLGQLIPAIPSFTLVSPADGDASQKSQEDDYQGEDLVSGANDLPLLCRSESVGAEDFESKDGSYSSSSGEEYAEEHLSITNKANKDKSATTIARKPSGRQVPQFKGDVEEGTEYLFKTHMCSECKRCFKKRTHLVEHLHLHFPDPSLQCPNCQRFFTSRSKLKIHMMRELGEKSHRCHLCDYSSVEKNALNRHMASMHEDISNFYSDTYSCPVCEEKFRLSQALKEHMKSHKPEQHLLLCFQEGCGSTTADRKEFLRHLKETHGIKAVECRYHACSLLFGTREEMETHRQSHYAFHCEQCTFVCSNKHTYRKHKRQGHPGSKELECSFCPFRTFNPVQFSNHVGKMHANEKIHKCTECDFATAHKRVLNRHMLLHTGEKPHKCQHCDFTCRDVSYLSKHMLTHSSDKNFMCTECGYITKWKHYLNVHMRKHTGDLRYHCNQCSYRCHRADQLSSHKLRHQGKSLICEVCGFACKRKYELQKHKQAKHSQSYQMPVYHCQFCSYQSKYKQALHNHENCKHTKQKEFRCALCTYRTFSNTSLFLHKRKIHGYIPGDKKWLENYANKELEINSVDRSMNFDLHTVLRLEASITPSGQDIWQRAKAPNVETQNSDYPQINDAPSSEGEHLHFKQIVEAVRNLEEKSKDPMEDESSDLFAHTSTFATRPAFPDLTLDNNMSYNVQLESNGSQVVTAGSPKASPDKQLEERETLGFKKTEIAFSHMDAEHSMVNDNMEILPEAGMPDKARTEENSTIMKEVDGVVEKHAVDAQEREHSCALQSLVDEQSLSCDKYPLDADHEKNEQISIDIQETWDRVLKPGALFTIDLTVCESGTSEPHCLTDLSAALPEEEEVKSESALEILRKQDKEQAETLVLQGRVQMLVLQSDPQVFKCGNCPFITRKERSLCLHSKAGCLTRKSPLLCKECGASFKQKRGLNTHIMRKCPAIQGKGKGRSAFYIEHGQCPRFRQSTLRLKNMSSHQFSASVNRKLPDEIVQAAECVENSIESLQDTASKTVDDLCAPVEVVYEDVSCEQLSDTLVRDMLSSSNIVIRNEDHNSLPVIDKYTFKQGKFHCSGCSFVCSRISSITTHVEEACKCLELWQCLLCMESFRSKKALKAHHGVKHLGLETVLESGGGTCSSKDGGSSDEIGGYETDDSGSYQMERAPGPVNSKKRTVAKKGNILKAQCLRCPTCPFICYQERAMETHRKRGCLKFCEFQCNSCSFRCKSSKALNHHKQLHKKLYCKRPQLRCTQCDFTCKQSRCLKQHVKIRHEGVKPHRCTYCDFSTTRRYRLEAHESMHTGVGRITCDVCSQTFGTNSKLRLHKLRVHEKKPTHFCTLCDYSGYNQNDITRHMSSCHNGELSFACSRCEARFSSDTALKQHCLRKHEEKICLSCQHCLFVCHSDATLKCHMQKQHPHLECGTCNEVFDSRDDLEDHKKSHFSHRCEFCDFASKERQQLVQHYLEDHESSASQEQNLRCPFCDFCCQHQLVYNHHMKGHGGTRAYKCADCPYTTKNKQKITWHIRIHTGEKPYKCHLCIYACADPSRLKYHMRIHKDERKYLCPDCGYKCKWVNQLKYHMTKHTGYKPYQCDECAYCTNRADALRIHKETRHRDTRSFICEQCGKAFKTRFLLKTHMKKHSEDKPYVCNVCLRGFRWAAGLRHHYLTHTKQHPFFCRFCSYKAKQKFQVIKHIRRHHPESATSSAQDGVGKDPSTPTVHLQDVQLESIARSLSILKAPAEAVG